MSMEMVVEREDRIEVGREIDARLVEQFAQSGDAAAFEELVRRHGGMVLGVCRRMLKDPGDVEDAFQSVFLILARKAGGIGKRELIGNWLYGVAYRVAARARGRRWRTARREVAMAEMKEMTGHGSGPMDEAIRREVRAALDVQINRLPGKYRKTIVLCYFEGLSKEEAAMALGAPPGTVSTWLARGRQMLAEMMGGVGGAISAGVVGEVLMEQVVVPQVLARAAANVGVGGMAAAPTGVAMLTKGTVTAMWLSKIKLTTAVMLLVAALTGSVAAVIKAAGEEPQAVKVAQNAGSGAQPAAAQQGPYAAAEGWVWRIAPLSGGSSLWSSQGMVAFMDENKDGGLMVTLAYQNAGELRGVAFDKNGKRYEMESGGGGNSEGVSLFRHELDGKILARKAVDRFGVEEITQRGRVMRTEQAVAKAKELGLEILPRPKVGEVYQFALTDVSGKKLKSEDYRGKVLIIDMWATWCGPCVAELPALKKLHQKHHERGLEVIGVSLDQKKEKMNDMVEVMGLSWPQVLVPEDREIRAMWQEVNGIHSIPKVLVIDREGVLRGDEWRGEELEREVVRLMGN